VRMKPGTKLTVTASDVAVLIVIRWRTLPLSESAQRGRARPMRSVEEMARPAVFASDAKLEAFLAHVTVARHADVVQ
jgi:hypothetical protein